MAKRRARTRVRTERADATRNGRVANGAESTVVPRVLLGAVNGVEVVATGVLKFSRDVLLSAVSGAADIGAEALTATVGGARGVISATSRMVGDIAGTAQGTFIEAYNDARHARAGMARVALRRPPARMGDEPNAATTELSAEGPGAGRRGRRSRAARTSAAA